MRRVLLLEAMVCLAVLTARAQDPVKVDSKHYKVEFENTHVRVLRVHHDPHDSAPMHEHLASVVVWLTEAHEKLTYPDGKAQESHSKAGQVNWTDGTKHAVENRSDQPFKEILVGLTD